MTGPEEPEAGKFGSKVVLTTRPHQEDLLADLKIITLSAHSEWTTSAVLINGTDFSIAKDKHVVWAVGADPALPKRPTPPKRKGPSLRELARKYEAEKKEAVLKKCLPYENCCGVFAFATALQIEYEEAHKLLGEGSCFSMEEMCRILGKMRIKHKYLDDLEEIEKYRGCRIILGETWGDVERAEAESLGGHYWVWCPVRQGVYDVGVQSVHPPTFDDRYNDFPRDLNDLNKRPQEWCALVLL